MSVCIFLSERSFLPGFCHRFAVLITELMSDLFDAPLICNLGLLGSLHGVGRPTQLRKPHSL